MAVVTADQAGERPQQRTHPGPEVLPAGRRAGRRRAERPGAGQQVPGLDAERGAVVQDPAHLTAAFATDAGAEKSIIAFHNGLVVFSADLGINQPPAG
ncbi:hypothetical protein [Micromonospora chersina]|uniref:hypothetical protein n=1 Tax=Micromonospora chersina TaxID=47854 RepID=UPI003714421D